MRGQSDFVRSLPGDPSALSIQAGHFRRWHIDLPLLVLLIAVAFFGLIVLYSASGKELGRVLRQLIYLGISFSGLFIVAQIKVKTLKSLAPLGYVLGIFLLLLVA
ncbi:MAG: rod shape-determining protein RodA, partial [Cellvibrionales bacterium]|nr:rod shape-determining protein RodA [Cellvibrionales bacterium]